PAHGPPRTPGARCVVGHRVRLDGRDVEATTTRPALDRLAGEPVDDYPAPARPWGADAPRWTTPRGTSGADG
ncbi:MAG: hypothetical protein ACTIAJ_15665, partial [Cellulosimicrobium funkei]